MDEIRYREFALRADCQRDPEGLAALDRLGWDTFRLKLRAWYETGCWQEGTRALTLFREREAVSSLFASPMELSWQGRQIPAVQIGAGSSSPAPGEGHHPLYPARRREPFRLGQALPVPAGLDLSGTRGKASRALPKGQSLRL